MSSAVRFVVVNGVRLSLRRPDDEPDYCGLSRRVHAIARMYDVPASETVSRIYEDNKACAVYEVDLLPEFPLHIARIFANDIRDLFREIGGYNWLTVLHRGRRLVDDEPWWPEAA
jgi:hypothetical protein